MLNKPSILDSILATPAAGCNSVTPAIRASLLSSLLVDLRSLFMSGVSSAFVALVALMTLHQIWPAVWLVAGLTVLAARFAIARTYIVASRSSIIHPLRSVQRYALLALLASGLLGAGSMGCLMSGDVGASALAIMVTAGTLGGIASRNAGTPRLAVLQIAIGAIPIGIGALLAPTHVYWVLVPPLFAYHVAMAAIVRRHYSTLVTVMVAEQKHADLAARFDAALTHMPHGLCTLDEAGKVVVANRRTAELFGATAERLRFNVPLPEFIGHVSLAKFGETLRQLMVERCTAWLSEPRTPLDLKLGDGRQLQMTRNPVPGGSAVVIIEDVTERRRTEAKILHWARHDPLTGLPNRRHLRELLDRAQSASVNGPYTEPAVLYLDLDDFKQVNDKFGHHAGDEVLRAVAYRLKRSVRRGGTVARFGGDEFAVIVENATHDLVAALSQRIIERLAEPYRLSMGATATIGVSVGVAFARKGESYGALTKRADRALYAAKAAGKRTFCIMRPDDARSNSAPTPPLSVPPAPSLETR